MTRITIEVDGSEVQSPKAISSPATQQPGAAGGGAGAASAELLAQAAAIGALNAGPAPSMDSPSGFAPIAASVTGPGMESSHPTVSAGAPPEHLFV
jgi:hypothetical protein